MGVLKTLSHPPALPTVHRELNFFTNPPHTFYHSICFPWGETSVARDHKPNFLKPKANEAFPFLI